LQSDAGYCKQHYRNLCNATDKEKDSIWQRRRNNAIDLGWDVCHAMQRFVKNAGISGTTCTMRNHKNSLTTQFIVQSHAENGNIIRN
jgi:hypothetical protein